jgi:phosphoglycolate phosphatase-like HAD superfamily hydrolase
MQRLVLFDIDGTLLTTDGAAADALRRAMREVFGTSGPTSGYSFAGRTDPQITHDLMRMAGVEGGRVETGLEEVWRRDLADLEERLRDRRFAPFPGVVELVERLDRSPDAVLGLLTGNLRDGARLKLRAAGLDFDRFAVGAFGSDHADRSELPALAVARAEERFSHRFSGKAVVIIGDTPLDVACGEHLGVRTLAVATGSYGVEALRATGADHVFPSLADVDAVWRAIFD